jgi:hypothetical protein
MIGLLLKLDPVSSRDWVHPSLRFKLSLNAVHFVPLIVSTGAERFGVR